MRVKKLLHLGQKAENIQDWNDYLERMTQKHAQNNPERDFQELTKVS